MDNMEEKKENLIQVDLREIMETSFLDYIHVRYRGACAAGTCATA